MPESEEMHEPSQHERLRHRLRHVEEAIAAHPLASERVRQSHEFIEQSEGEDQEVISRGLAERGLPSLEQLGKLTVRHTLSWWNLHRKKNRLDKKLFRLQE